MHARINDTEVFFPTRSHLTLGQRIDFYNQHGRLLDQMLISINEITDEEEREVEMAGLYSERVIRTFAFFSGSTVEAVKESGEYEQVAVLYSFYLSDLFTDLDIEIPQRSFTWNDQEWILPNPELSNSSDMKFGEFLDAKQTVKDLAEQGAGKWEIMHKICAIYLRKKGEKYSEAFLFEGSSRLEELLSLPMEIAEHVGLFFDQHNEFLDNHFEVFRKSRVKSSGKHTKKHFELYGWINFLKGIAATKVFDISGQGKNSIECAREARLFDVLIYASEDKSFNEAQALDYETEAKKAKKKSKS